MTQGQGQVVGGPCQARLWGGEMVVSEARRAFGTSQWGREKGLEQGPSRLLRWQFDW